MKKTNLNLKIFLALFLLSRIITGQELTILHTNDMHSKLAGYGPESEYSPMVTGNDSTKGGFARLATLFQQAREKSPESTLILDAGDFLMGSLFHVAEEETGFQLNLMKELGYDYITLGNHEFDFGPGALANILNSAEKRGGYPQIIATNIVFSKNSAEDDELEKLYTDKSILPYAVFEKNGLKIGIIGLVGIDAASVAPASKPVTFSHPAKEAAKISRYLKNEKKADLVIALSHSGIYPEKDREGYSGEDMDMARKAPLIDIIISGHTHVKTPEYIKTGSTYIVQTGCDGADLGVIKLRVENGQISDFTFKLTPVDDRIMGDMTVSGEIGDHIRFIDREYLAASGLAYKQIVGRTNFDLKIDFSDLQSSNLGPFIADASKYYLTSTGDHADFSLVASGTIRENLPRGMNGKIIVADVFRVMSLGKGYDQVPGYPLAKIHLTANEVKKLMEVLVMSRAKGGDSYLYFSGIKVTIDSGKGFLRKVQKIEIGEEEIDFSKKNKTMYSVTANTYLLSFIGEIKKMSFGLVKVVPKDKDGMPVTDMRNQLVDIDPDREGVQEAKEWIALIEYMKSFETDSDDIPVIPDIYKKGDEAVVDISK